jgi:hypothetical protein|tara:strand:- start:4644 stop:5084 length:441 start_codon:yes stop_codon:yes gene_type:complete
MLQEVAVTEFPKIKEIVERNISACKVESRTSFDYINATATLFASQNNIGVWVDDIEKPTALLIVTSGKFGVLNEVFAFVNTIYIDEDRRTPELLKSMADTAALWAKSRGCKTLQISSWIYRGCPDISSVWVKSGFEPQETIFVKEV